MLGLFENIGHKYDFQGVVVSAWGWGGGPDPKKKVLTDH